MDIIPEESQPASEQPADPFAVESDAAATEVNKDISGEVEATFQTEAEVSETTEPAPVAPEDIEASGNEGIIEQPEEGAKAQL